jgi:hypothetical protein
MKIITLVGRDEITIRYLRAFVHGAVLYDADHRGRRSTVRE